jgi:putative transcription factor
MNCEVCGREILGEAFSVKIEGTLMRTCRPCARFGKRAIVRGQRARPRQTHRTPQHSTVRKEREAGSITDTVENYSKIIRERREKAGLTQEQLGAKINEKGSVIARLESGHMKPDIKVAKKLERLFEIKLLQAMEE